MSRGPRIDWSKVDFSRSANLIAEELGCSLPAVYAARRKFYDENGKQSQFASAAQPKPVQPLASEPSVPVSQIPSIDWSKIDFRRTPDQIAQDLGCSVADVYVAWREYRGGGGKPQAAPQGPAAMPRQSPPVAAPRQDPPAACPQPKPAQAEEKPVPTQTPPASPAPSMPDSSELIASVGHAIQDKAALIWNVANSLFGAFKPHEYGLVILPMVVIKRFHDCLLPTHDAVVAKAREIAGLAVKAPFLTKASGFQFYNTSPFTFETLRADPDNVVDNFRAYLNGFSENVQDILTRMMFSTQIDRMEEAGCLYQVIDDFCSARADMSPDKISAVDMGYIFENLVQRFSESYNEEAGAHFTSRDIIYLMCDLLVTGDRQAFAGSGITRTVYDMTMGTSQMLTCMEERLKQLDTNATVTCFGQELNPFTFGIAKADMLIRGGNPDNMRFGDTLDDDRFSGFTFDYCISNPPFGIDWKREADSVEKEAARGAEGRFWPGLPSKSDGQMLFLLNGLSKLKPEGRLAIIQNGSSLFTGDAGSGQSEIRRHLIENDWLDAIVQLPNDSFYNTGIATYVWIITKDKPAGHEGKVQLIDASKCFEPRRKSIGSKRVDITNPCRDLIVEAYAHYVDGTYEGTTADGKPLVCKSRVLDGKSLGYSKIVVETPKRDASGNMVMRSGRPVADTTRRDTENVPLTEGIADYFKREVLPYNPGAWIDEGKTKVGYEIPFTRIFYEYKPIESAADIARRIEERERVLMAKLHALFGGTEE
ncbi:MAG: N-6 DNA methylase [Desulfovibrio sp.]|nr:N-6 DNA methylase [Desulfovibrio sp.]